jgi:hypothetical protein
MGDDVGGGKTGRTRSQKRKGKDEQRQNDGGCFAHIGQETGQAHHRKGSGASLNPKPYLALNGKGKREASRKRSHRQLLLQRSLLRQP